MSEPELARKREPLQRNQETATPSIVAPANAVATSYESVLAHRQASRTGDEPITRHKVVLLQQAMALAETGFNVLERAADGALAAMEEPEIPRTNFTRTLLIAAGGAAIGACAGPVAGMFAAQVMAELEAPIAKRVSSLASSAFEKAMGNPETSGALDVKQLKMGFRDAVFMQQLAARQRFAGEWESVGMELAALPDEHLAALNRRLQSADTSAQYTTMKRQLLISWTNFLARAKHGASPGWDYWKDPNGSKGAIPLDGAQPGPSPGRADPTANNVAPEKMGWAFERTQRPMMSDHYGVLEIFLHGGRLVREPGYGMRLGNVGPDVRAELKALGRVRDLPINKIVRICSYKKNNVDVNPPAIVGGVLITADGYVRRNELLPSLHFDARPTGDVLDPLGFQACSRELIRGRESQDCHYEHDRHTQDARSLAEHAQDLPLSYLEP
jgi:hypothetical protein